MRRDQLEHLLRAASTITDDPNVIVFGSQAILGSFAEQLLPPEATFSVEADFTFFNDSDDDKSDGAIGELSMFHETLASTHKAFPSRQPYCHSAGKTALS
jgi:hypothetical protein